MPEPSLLSPWKLPNEICFGMSWGEPCDTAGGRSDDTRLRRSGNAKSTAIQMQMIHHPIAGNENRDRSLRTSGAATDSVDAATTDIVIPSSRSECAAAMH